jgi:hypothetical protein
MDTILVVRRVSGRTDLGRWYSGVRCDLYGTPWYSRALEVRLISVGGAALEGGEFDEVAVGVEGVVEREGEFS